MISVVRRFLICLYLAALPARGAPGQAVVVARPQDPEGRSVEAYHRLGGELTLHGFEVVLLDVEGDLGVVRLERLAAERNAIACIALVPVTTEGTSETRLIEIRLADRLTGKRIQRTVEDRGPPDGATLLAVQARELLRSSLRESERPELPPRAPPPKEPATRPEATAAHRYWSLGAGAALGWSGPDGSLTGGPEVSVGYVWGAFGLRLTGLGPLLGGLVETDSARFHYLSLSILAEPGWSPITVGRFGLTLFPTIGTSYLEVRGEASAPYAGRDDSRWLFAAGAGAEGVVRVRPEVLFYLGGRVRAAFPEPRVVLGEETLSLGRPELGLSLGLRVTL